ncbi:hypothetical protein [Methylobacterium gregans]|uniref:Uncharacterized protein n=1 Tax=Methylobacterium gregans TaxID=374424 RepID=A0AA37MB26_9HYPH|nr:hypothetical protein [Methylobacterium gregans]MDQ0520711.1 hypothetical protein [Methylobacterium gregans]GJD78393.1 hypothetical protein NBEOAGPD_1607 [Methylobacterium gregans]
MVHHVAVALLGGFLTIALGWRSLGLGALVLAPLAASLGTLAVAVLLDHRARRVAPAGSWIRDIEAGTPRTVANDRRTDPGALCRRRA